MASPGVAALSAAIRLADQGLSRAAGGAWDQARELLARAEGASPRGRAWLQIALGYLALGEAESARRALASAEGDLASNPAIHLFRALAACDLGEWEQARKDWWAARNLSPGNQAIPTARAVRYLGENRIEEALLVLAPRDARKAVDLSVSAPVIGRLAVALEKRLLPLELPASLEPPAGPPPEPPAPGGAAFVLSRRGQRRLQSAWRLPDPQRGEEALLAVAELRAARDRDPKAFRASYHLGEALLTAAEFARDRDVPPDEVTLARVREAEACFEASRQNDSSNAYVLHFLARCALLQRRFRQAAALWRKALEGFEKFPEAHYGLGQALLALGEDRDARHHLLQAILSDLHLLRERVADLARVFRANPELFRRPVHYPLWEAPAPSGACAGAASQEAVSPGAQAPPPEASVQSPPPEAAAGDPPPPADPR